MLMEVSMMKKYWLIFVLLSLIPAACKSQSPFTNNGNPGQIKVIAYYDDNRNGQINENESGPSIRIGISQDISCPASSLDKVAQLDSDQNGVGVFSNLKPGKYCVSLIGNYDMTTKMNPQVYLSSDQEIVVRLGLLR
jgi:uncharacterized protein (DUF2141 family)